jgi:protein-S-isoprenylcysteine O-methyltransferase Ste14
MVRRGLRQQLGQAAILFAAAGSFKYWQGWAYIGLHSVLQFSLMIYFYRRDPQVLERRLLTREKNREQKIVIVALRLVVASVLVLSGLDYRQGWSRSHFSPVSPWLTLLALLAIAGGQWLFFRILQTNRFAASIIRVEAGQTVAGTGPYRHLRHPMYLAMVIHWLAAPLALGSWVALAAGIFIIPVAAFRLLHEERILRRDLAGYGDYCRQTRWRLIPLVW